MSAPEEVASASRIHRVAFPLMGQFHQAYHSLPIAAALAQQHRDIQVHIAASTPRHAEFAARLMAQHAPQAPITIDTLKMGWLDEIRLSCGASVTWKAYTLLRNRRYFLEGLHAAEKP